MLKCLKEKTIQTIFKSGMFLKTECCCYCCCCYCYVTNHVISPACLTCQMLEPLPRVQGYLREYQRLLLLQSGSTLNTGQSYSYYYHSIASHFVSWSNIYLVFLFPFFCAVVACRTFVARLHLIAPIVFWQNSTPFFGATEDDI